VLFNDVLNKASLEVPILRNKQLQMVRLLLLQILKRGGRLTVNSKVRLESQSKENRVDFRPSSLKCKWNIRCKESGMNKSYLAFDLVCDSRKCTNKQRIE
jgi:hypothetical protein